MFKFRSNSVLRFNLLVICIFTLVGVWIIGKAAIIMFVERDHWNKIKEKNFKRNVPIEARRGNILADDGNLIVSTLPQYRLKFDFVYINDDDKKDEERGNAQRDSIWNKHLHELCVGMNEILPGTSVAELEKRFKEGREQRRGGYEPYRGNISYSQYQEIQKLPIIKEGRRYSGCYTKDNTERKNILGNTGNSTFGVARVVELNGRKVLETTGLEKMYNEYLQGKEGVGTRAKIGGKWILREDRQPKDGYDVQTTLNTKMLDICRTALERELRAKSLAAGWAILMETKTGDIKAVVNLARHVKDNGIVVYTDTIGEVISKVYSKERKDTAIYKETRNLAFGDINQPGSIFKTVALTAILTDGKLTTKDSVYSYKKKVYSFDGHKISDEMYRDNGTGKYSMSDAMMYSSNIGLVQFTRNAYINNPSEYTNTLKRFGLTQNYRILGEDEQTPSFPEPGNPQGNHLKWDKYSINSLGMGYAINMTGINIVSFYNTIANGGKQVQPRLVKAILDDGKVVKSFPTKVLNEQLFPKAVADTITGMLIKVVNGKTIDRVNTWRMGVNEGRDGTGKNAYSEHMTIAGKTGTALSYRNPKDKLLSFCGFFPAEEPEYTLIVQIKYDYAIDPRPEKIKDDEGYGGGSTSALVFKEIAEKIMAERFATPLEKAGNEKPSKPKIKRGNLKESNQLLVDIGLQDSIFPIEKGKEWGDIKFGKDGNVKPATVKIDPDKVPDVKGMGAKDATYLLQECGLDVKINGYGVVKRQSIEPGKKIVEGKTIELILQP